MPFQLYWRIRVLVFFEKVPDESRITWRVVRKGMAKRGVVAWSPWAHLACRTNPQFGEDK
jgi:hypothetical protein